MNLVKVKCAFCGKEFFRERGRYNEAKKFTWNQYCSKECQSKLKTKRVKMVCGNPNCNNKVLRELNQFRKSKSGLIFCSRSCAAIVGNKKYPRKHPEPKFRICVNCGRRFRESTGNKKYCSIGCRREIEWHSPEEIINIIRNTAKRIGRVPARREIIGINAACKKFFGSWSKAIIAAGFKPNRSHSQQMYRRTRTRARDGHVCDSVSEAIIDNWLSRNNIAHEKNVPYPKTNHRADWGIKFEEKFIFVEYFGLANDSARYDRTINKKRVLCRKNGLLLIAIYPQDLYPKRLLDKKLKERFREIVA